MLIQIGDFVRDKHNTRIYEVTHINQYDWGLCYWMSNVYPGDTAEVYKVKREDLLDYFELAPHARVLYGNKVQTKDIRKK